MFAYSWDRCNDRDTLTGVLAEIFPAKCNEWASEDDEDNFSFDSIPPAPCTLRQARRDPRFYQVLLSVLPEKGFS